MTQKLPEWIVVVNKNTGVEDGLLFICPTCDVPVLDTKDGQGSCCEATHRFTGDKSSLRRWTI